MKELFFELKQTADKKEWAKGVALSRNPKIALFKESVEEVFFSVPDTSTDLIRKPKLYPEELDWECNCSGENDPCCHVIAACIAYKNFKENRGDLKVASNSVGLEYRILKIEDSKIFISRAGQGSEIHERIDEALKKKFDIAPEELLMDNLFQRQDQSLTISMSHIEKFFKLFETMKKKIVYQDRPYSLLSSGELFECESRVLSDSVFVKILTKKSVIKLAESLYLDTEKEVILLSKKQSLDLKLIEKLSKGQKFSFSNLEYYYEAVAKPILKIGLSCQSPKRVKVLPHLVLDPVPGPSNLYRGLYQLRIVYGNPRYGLIKEGKLECYEFILPYRDFRAEDELKRKTVQKLGYHIGEEFELDHKEVPFLLEKMGSQSSAQTCNIEKPEIYKIIPNTKFIDGQFELDWQFQGETDSSLAPSSAKLSANQILSSWEMSEPVVRLNDGSLAHIPMDWLDQYGPILSSLLHFKEQNQEVPKYMQGQVKQILESESGSEKDVSQFVKELEQTDTWNYKAEGISLEGVELRSYQKDGIAWLKNVSSLDGGALLADDMGLGKTLQTICCLKKNSLVIVPTSLMINWTKEIERFRPELSFNIYHGPARKLDNSDATITSYGVLRRDLEILREKKWDLIVCDEAQALKNPSSQVSSAVHSLSAPFRIGLSGTPIENKIEELWSIFRFLNPGLLGNLKQFSEQVLKPIQVGNENRLQYLRNTIKPFVLRRLKKDVAKDLPAKVEQVLWVKLSEAETACYNSAQLLAKQEVLDHFGADQSQKGSVLKALEALLRMRQASCHIGLLPGQSAESSSKVDLLIERVEEAIQLDSKVLIFSQWTSFLDIIESKFSEHKIDTLRIDGSTNNRQEIVDRFQTDSESRVLLMSLKAGGTGLNLTAADQVYIMDPWWNPATEQQAADRAYRIGQKKTVFVYRMIASDSIEEKIEELKKHKLLLSDDILQGSFESSQLSKADILNLLG